MASSKSSFDDTVLDPAVDLYNTPDVITTGVLSFSKQRSQPERIVSPSKSLVPTPRLSKPTWSPSITFD